MPLAYYSASASSDFWAEHWGRHSPASLARLAETSPLTDLIVDGLPPRGARVLEAGCGLGQYVALLRDRGYRAIGADWTLEPLRACREWRPATPLTVMDLRRLGVRAESLDAYVSLGVVEHDPGGPDAILREAHRALRAGGVLVLSVPYVNGVRRCAAWWTRRRGARLRAAGADFYQFAFSRGEARRFIEANGFRVVRARPYDPARLVRASWRRLRGAPAGDPIAANGVGEPVRARSGAAGLAKRLLYTRPGLAALGHMILFVAVKR